MVDSNNGEVGEWNDDLSLVVDTTNSKSAKKSIKNWPNLMAFANGASAGFALKGPCFLIHKLINIVNPEAANLGKFWNFRDNPRAILKGIPNAILMESVFAAALLAPYEILRKKLEYANKGMPLSPYQGFGCAVVSGAIGGCLTTPFFMSSARLKAANNTHSFLLHDIYHKAANEGILSLWKSGGVTTSRVFVTNVGILATYKPSFDYLRDSVGLDKTTSVLGAGFVSGFFGPACSYPYIYVQDTLKNMKPGVDGKYPYNGYVDCAHKIIRSGGPFAIYRGSKTFFLELTPGFTLLWFFFEQLKKINESP